MKRNLWMSDRHSIAYWFINFPKTISNRHIETMLRFAEGLLQAGEAEQIYRVEKLDADDASASHSNQWYADYMRATWEQTGTLPFFFTSRFVIQQSSRLCYWDAEGEIVEAKVDNMAALIQKLHPDYDSGAWADRGPALDIWSSADLTVTQDFQPNIILSINLHTDIWFPKLVGWLTDEHRTTPETMYDNRQLALCHTPRLNRFIERAYELTQEAGAEWVFSLGDCAGSYRHMLHDKGIRLDI